MIARLYAMLPLPLSVPDKESFRVYKYCDDGYEIMIYPPVKTELAAKNDLTDELLIDGKPSFQADTIRIDFHKENFERTKNTDCDPSYAFINRTANLFLSKLSFVTRSSKIHLIDFPGTTWKLQYLNDDGSELEEDEQLVRTRFGKRFSFSWTAMNKEIWEALFKLPMDYTVPKWEELLLDADAALPGIGPSIVLAWTALEVFISSILGQLPKNGVIHQGLWEWLNARDWLRSPTIEEQFDVLLKQFVGSSLKEEAELWEVFKNLKTARNSFVHEGIAKIGKDEISQEVARTFVRRAREIITFVKGKLPDTLKWPDHKFQIEIKGKHRLL